jgi:hypothetical protein
MLTYIDQIHNASRSDSNSSSHSHCSAATTTTTSDSHAQEDAISHAQESTINHEQQQLFDPSICSTHGTLYQSDAQESRRSPVA